MKEAHAQEVNMRGLNSTAKTYMNEQIRPILVALLIVTTLVVTSAGAAGASRRLRLDPVPTNVARTQPPTHESEETVAGYPANPRHTVPLTTAGPPAPRLFEGLEIDCAPAS